MDFMETTFVVATGTLAAGFRPNGEWVTWGKSPFKKGIYIIRNNVCRECDEVDLMDYTELVPREARERNAHILEELGDIPKWGTAFDQLAEILT